jgi:GntR family transcriptional regulator
MAAVEVARERGARPLYIQLAEDISGRIRRGDLRPGDRVPSEPELMRLHAVSRATAVRALEHLERAGLVRREQGRGTFVREPHLVQRQPVLGSFSEQVRRHGHVPTQRLVQLATVVASDEPEAAQWFGEDGELARIVRLRIVDTEAVGVHSTVLRRETVEEAGIGESSFARPDASLYALLDAAGIHVVEAGDRGIQAGGQGPRREAGDAAHARRPRLVRPERLADRGHRCPVRRRPVRLQRFTRPPAPGVSHGGRAP